MPVFFGETCLYRIVFSDKKSRPYFLRTTFCLSFRVWVVFPVPPFQFFRVFLLAFRIVDRQPPDVQGARVSPKSFSGTIFFINFLRVFSFQVCKGIDALLFQIRRHFRPHTGNLAQLAFHDNPSLSEFLYHTNIIPEEF